MAQTGIPFGEINAAKDWLGIETSIGKPKKIHAKRPVYGFQCARSEVSGKRLWGWAKKMFDTPESGKSEGQ
jgi:single-strand selective monofunctional uracil DNA glycosylase